MPILLSMPEMGENKTESQQAIAVSKMLDMMLSLNKVNQEVGIAALFDCAIRASLRFNPDVSKTELFEKLSVLFDFTAVGERFGTRKNPVCLEIHNGALVEVPAGNDDDKTQS